MKKNRAKFKVGQVVMVHGYKEESFARIRKVRWNKEDSYWEYHMGPGFMFPYHNELELSGLTIREKG